MGKRKPPSNFKFDRDVLEHRRNNKTVKEIAKIMGVAVSAVQASVTRCGRKDPDTNALLPFLYPGQRNINHTFHNEHAERARRLPYFILQAEIGIPVGLEWSFVRCDYGEISLVNGVN